MSIFTDPSPVMQAIRRHRSQRYYSSTYGASGATALFSQNDLRLCPIFIPEAGMYDRIMVEVTTNGEAGSVSRMGWFETDDDCQEPLSSGSFTDFGTVATDTGAGGKVITIAQWLPRGIAWVGACSQNCPTTPPTLRSLSPGLYPSCATGLASYAGSGGVWQTPGIAGAFVPWVAGAVSGGSVVPKIWIRRA